VSSSHQSPVTAVELFKNQTAETANPGESRNPGNPALENLNEHWFVVVTIITKSWF
jgi:hypothetical protein